MYQKNFPNSQPRIIHAHTDHIEKQVGTKAYFKNHAGKSVQHHLLAAANPGNKLIQYYSLTKPNTVSAFEDVSDPGLK
jgi:hypothetical protein